MKFQLICLGFVYNFSYDSARTSKSIRNNTAEKMLLATALACLLRMSTDVYCSKQTGSSSTKGNHHPSFLRFWNWAKKTVDAAKICGGAENVVKTETQQTFVNGLLGFNTLGIYTPLEAHVLLTIIAWVAHRYGQLYLHCSLIYFWVPSSCFCIVINLSLVEIIAFSGVCQSGERIIRRRRWWLHWRQTALMCNRRDQRQHHHAEHHFQL